MVEGSPSFPDIQASMHGPICEAMPGLMAMERKESDYGCGEGGWRSVGHGSDEIKPSDDKSGIPRGVVLLSIRRWYCPIWFSVVFVILEGLIEVRSTQCENEEQLSKWKNHLSKDAVLVIFFYYYGHNNTSNIEESLGKSVVGRESVFFVMLALNNYPPHGPSFGVGRVHHVSQNHSHFSGKPPPTGNC